MFKTYRFKATKHLWEMYRDVCKKGAAHDWLQEAHLQVLLEYWAFKESKDKLRKAKANKASAKGGSLYCGGSTTL